MRSTSLKVDNVLTGRFDEASNLRLSGDLQRISVRDGPQLLMYTLVLR